MNRHPLQSHRDHVALWILIAALITLFHVVSSQAQTTYPIVDTGQDRTFDTYAEITPPPDGAPFFGQDAQYQGLAFDFIVNGDGTVTDHNTGLMWQQTPALYDKMSWDEAVAGADTFSLAGYDDWRLPTVKELYSLMDFRGGSPYLEPYIDTTYFDFRWGETGLGERVIDTQYWSSNEYLGTVFQQETSATFGVNFGDGRIKGYPNGDPHGPPGTGMDAFVRYVRGNPEYGTNDFVDNGDGTITDNATGLTWLQADNGETYSWEEALTYAESLEFGGYDDWRLPNIKELHSIVDYDRAPDAPNPEDQGPAIADVFTLTDESAWMWSSTTLREVPADLGEGSQAAYMCFGMGTGIYGSEAIDVHGAGAQRSDPKTGDPDDYPDGFGPQNDEIRIFNYVLPVRGGAVTAVDEDELRTIQDSSSRPAHYGLSPAWPNPFNGQTRLQVTIPDARYTVVTIHNSLGRVVATLVRGPLAGGEHEITWTPRHAASGTYYVRLRAGDVRDAQRISLVK